MKAVKHGVGRLYLIFQIEDNEKQMDHKKQCMSDLFDFPIGQTTQGIQLAG